MNSISTLPLTGRNVIEVASLTIERMKGRKIWGEWRGTDIPLSIADTVEEGFP